MCKIASEPYKTMYVFMHITMYIYVYTIGENGWKYISNYIKHFIAFYNVVNMNFIQNKRSQKTFFYHIIIYTL